MSLANKLAINDVDLKDKRVLIRVRTASMSRGGRANIAGRLQRSP